MFVVWLFVMENEMLMSVHPNTKREREREREGEGERRGGMEGKG